MIASILALGGMNTAQNISSGSCRPFYSPLQLSEGADTFTPLPKNMPMTASGVLAELNERDALHAANSSGRWDYFKKNGDFTIADFDLELDDRGQLIVAHDNPKYLLGSSFNFNRMSFVDTMAERLADMEKLPPGKLAAVKLDVKDTVAYEQLIPLLEQHAGLFENTLLIINDGFSRQHPGRDPKLAAVKKIKEMIPNTIVSIAAQKHEDLHDAGFRPSMERIMAALGDGVYTIAVHNEQELPPGWFEWLDANNAFMTLWASKTGLTCGAGEKDWVTDQFRSRIAPEYHDRFWAEF